MKTTFLDKLKESSSSILPIALIILVLCFVLGVDTYRLALFLIGAVLLILGLAGFTMGADMSMLVIGEKIGVTVTRSGKIWLVALISFVIGVIVTIAEPDLQILAGYIADELDVGFLSDLIGSYWVLIITVAIGVGIFLMIAMLRIVFRVKLSVLLIAFYLVAFALAFLFVDSSFWSIAFDAGGVTTGPLTVPFIMSMGVGIASIRSDRKGQDDSFGLVALSSVGPIIAVLILAIIGNVSGVEYPVSTIAGTEVVSGTTQDVFAEYLEGILEYAEEVGISLAPIVGFFFLFQIFTRAFRKQQMTRILVGFVTIYLGMVIFLTGANVGFMPVGSVIGQMLGEAYGGWLLIPVGMLIGYFIVSAEPAVHVLNKQVERMTAGAIKASTMRTAMSVSVCCSLGLAMLRIVLDINIMWVLVPGYALALILTFFTPGMFTGIAFDSGGVASGAMVSAFVLPMAIGACYVISGASAAADIMTQAFGCVAFVAMMPLIVIQIFGIIYQHKRVRIRRNFVSVEDRIIVYRVN